MEVKPVNAIMEGSFYPGVGPRDHNLDASDLNKIKFGQEMKREFLLKPQVSFFNHGSYGTVPRRVLDMQIKYMLEREEHPDFWFRLTAKHYVDQARKAIAEFVGADVENLFLVSNATTAINLILRSYPFKSGNALLDTNLSYGSVKNLCEDFTSRVRPDVKRIQLQFNFPIESEDHIVQKYREILEKHPEIKLVIVDHITSPTSILLPVKKIVDVCHQHGSVVLVDGAHCVGQIPLDMKDIGADIYTSNLHKWLYTSRGSAFLWFKSEHASWVQPENTSWQIGLSLDKQFFDQGTRDHVPFICARHGLQFYQAIGGMDKVVGYTSALADAAKEIFTKEVGLETLPVPSSLEAPNIRMFKLPPFPKFPVDQDNSWLIQRAMLSDTTTFGVLYLVSGTFYLRLSTQIYNDIEELKALATIVKDFIDNNS